jgi:hypothetical protein
MELLADIVIIPIPIDICSLAWPVIAGLKKLLKLGSSWVFH